MRTSFDAIVLGAGGVGSAAMLHLASRGLRVLGLDQHAPPHDLGSSHGESRIIRKAYFEHPDYVPLLRRAYELWDDLSARRGGPALLRRTGLLQIGPGDGVMIPGVMTSASLHGLDIRRMSAAEIGAEFPQYRVPPGFAGVFEADAGLLLVEDCVRAHLDQARAAGAELRTNAKVSGWRPSGGGVTVRTADGDLDAGALVITAGAWAPTLLQDLGIRFRVLRKPLFWLRARGTAHRSESGCPCFFYELPEGQFYGFPELPGACGVKLARHTGGDAIADPAGVDRALDEADLARVRTFAAAWLPQATPDLLRHATCLYTMSPDEHFVVDRHPEHPQVVFAAGLSGHGFKFASVLGERLAGMAIDRHSPGAGAFLSLRRFR